jgi:hypothetical protein
MTTTDINRYRRAMEEQDSFLAEFPSGRILEDPFLSVDPEDPEDPEDPGGDVA